MNKSVGRQHFFVDDLGNISYNTAQSLSVVGTAFGADSDQTDFLVRNLGHVTGRLGRGGLSIRCRPEFLSDETIAALCYAVADWEVRRILVESFDGTSWTQRLVFEKQFALASELARFLALPKAAKTSSVVSQRVSTKQLGNAQHLTVFIDYWKTRKTMGLNLDAAQLRTLLSTHGRNRFVAVEARGGFAPSVLAVGSGFHRFVYEALKPSIGQDLSDIADDTFGNFCASAYSTAAAENAPVLELVDAYIQAPNRRHIRRRYMRMILPFTDQKNGQPKLLGISWPDDAINLRRDAC